MISLKRPSVSLTIQYRTKNLEEIQDQIAICAKRDIKSKKEIKV